MLLHMPPAMPGGAHLVGCRLRAQHRSFCWLLTLWGFWFGFADLSVHEVS